MFGEGVYRFDDIGTVVEHNLKRELTLSNKDPLSAKYRIIQKMRNGRDGWLTDCDIDVTQTSDKEYFYITGFMDASINGEHDAVNGVGSVNSHQTEERNIINSHRHNV